jgi:hypothetical protein
MWDEGWDGGTWGSGATSLSGVGALRVRPELLTSETDSSITDIHPIFLAFSIVRHSIVQLVHSIERSCFGRSILRFDRQNRPPSMRRRQMQDPGRVRLMRLSEAMDASALPLVSSHLLLLSSFSPHKGTTLIILESMLVEYAAHIPLASDFGNQ